MTSDEYTAAQAKLNEIDTEAATLQQAIHEGVAKARAMNAMVRSGIDRRNALLATAQSLRAALGEHDARTIADKKQVEA